MKKKILIFLATFMCVWLCACGEDAEVSETEDSEKKDSVAEVVTPKGYETVELNNTITNEFCELTITKSVITHAATEDATGLNLQETADTVYIVFLGSVKNLGPTEINFLSGLQAQVLIDDKYTYPVEMLPYELGSIVPLESSNFSIYTSVPEEVISSCENYKFQFGFNEEFSVMISSIEDAAYKYEINGSMDEYGSAESIQNFQTFSEYINLFLDENGYSEKYGTRDINEQHVEICDGNSVKYVTRDGIKLSILPMLKLRYLGYRADLDNYGMFQLKIKGTSKQGDIYYISANTMTLKSSNGEITIGEGTDMISHYDYDSVSSQNIYTYDPDQISLAQVHSIVNGENFEIIIDAQLLKNDHFTMTYKCDDEFVQTINDLFDIYRQMPNIELK